MKFIGFKRVRKTFGIVFYNKKTKQVISYFIQLSLKNMWKLPHKENRFQNGSWICGWGFFYFGIIYK